MLQGLGLKTRFRSSVAGAALMLAAGAIAHQAHAQAAGSAPPQANPPGASTVDTVVVTAQKRAQNVQSVPIAISVLSRQDLADKHVVDLQDLQLLVPSVEFTQAYKDSPGIAIRGFGGGDPSPGQDPDVTAYIDGVAFNRPSDFGDLEFDIDRIEVLRGPQGTLFGKNVVGGAINITTIQPTNTPMAIVALTAGNYGRLESNALVAGPIIDDTLYGKLSFSSDNANGVTTNLTTGDKVDNTGRTSGRAELVYRPNDNFKLSVTGYASRIDETPQAEFLLGAPMTASGGGQATSGPSAGYEAFDGYFHKQAAGLYATAEYTFPWATLRSITSYRGFTQAELHDHWGTSFPLFGNLFEGDKLSEVSQELQLLSPSNHGPLTWVAGVYYEHTLDKYDANLGVDFPANSLAAFVNARDGFSDTPGADHVKQHVTVNSLAAYAQADYSITSQLTLTLGGRLTEDQKSADAGTQGEENFVLLTAPSFNVDVSHTWTAFTPKAALSYKPLRDVMFYASATRGYKAGGYEYLATSPQLASVPYQPEYTWDYEAGMKADFFDHRLRFNPNFFWTNLTNLQALTFNNGIVNVSNAGSTVSRGAELDVTARPIRELTLTADYAYLDAECLKDCPGGRFYPGQSPNTVDLGATYKVAQLVLGGSLSMGADWSYHSSQFTDANNTAALKTGDFSTLDARIIYSVGNVQLSFWGKNVSDKRWMEPITIDESPFFQTLSGYLAGNRDYRIAWSPPGTYGVTLTWRMGG